MEEELHSAIVQAGNAINSVSVKNFGLGLEANPHKAIHFWRAFVFGTIRRHALRGGQTIDMCDLGFGKGTVAVEMAKFAKEYGLDPSITGVDLMQENVMEAKKKELEEIGVDTSRIQCGDITQYFPEGVFDVVTALELIHWLNPEQIKKIFSQAREHMKQGSILIISYATELNNALLTNEDGNLDLARSNGCTPLYKYSYATKTWMTFPNKSWIKDLGVKYDLVCGYYLETNNPFFPTTDRLNIHPHVRRSLRARTENACMALVAV